jgi:hypothetical protein
MAIRIPCLARPVCEDLDSSCFQLAFCEARRCSVDLRRGLVGRLAYCPVSGINAVAQYPDR